MKFGSEELHLALQKACDSHDLNYAAELLYEPVTRASRNLFTKRQDLFFPYNRQDQEDAMQNAMLYMLDRLDKLAYPPNEGTPNYSYYSAFVLNGLLQNRHEILVRRGIVSLDDTLTDHSARGDNKEKTYLDTQVSTAAGPDDIVVTRDNLALALKDLFNLKNDPDTLISVGFIILNEELGFKPMSMQQYADFLNGSQVTKVLSNVETFLNYLSIDVRILTPVRKRLLSVSEPLVYSDVTASKIANRKNSVLEKLRKKLKERQEKDED